MPLRIDLQSIVDWIEPESKVLDLGCGDGSLLSYLQKHNHVHGYGLEIDPDNIVSCINKGVNVIQRDIESGLTEFEDNFFDYVILTQTIQAVHYPSQILAEMLRVGRQGIVTLPNLGHWQCRLQMLLQGKTPVTKTFPHQWYNSPNLHVCTIRDFENFCQTESIRILERKVLDDAHGKSALINLLPNLLGALAVYRICPDK